MAKTDHELVKRITISLYPVTLEELDRLAEYYRLSRSGTITQLIREAIARLPTPQPRPEPDSSPRPATAARPGGEKE